MKQDFIRKLIDLLTPFDLAYQGPLDQRPDGKIMVIETHGLPCTISARVFESLDAFNKWRGR